jgi:hypothetical protein
LLPTIRPRVFQPVGLTALPLPDSDIPSSAKWSLSLLRRKLDAQKNLSIVCQGEQYTGADYLVATHRTCHRNARTSKCPEQLFTRRLNLRPRYETVDSAIRSETAEALTMRTLAGWETGSWYGLSAKAEFIWVGRAIDRYNDTLNAKSQYPIIADPDDLDVNQLYLDYRGIGNTLIRGGRQSIKLDNSRFIGNVAFRQVMQVFNGAIVENTSLPKTNLYAGYLARQKTVTTRQFDTDTILLNARYSPNPDNALVAYG